MKKTALILMTALAVSAHAGTLDTVKEKGKFVCGVSPGKAGFSSPDANNRWVGFDVDFCRAVAAAIFNDPEKVDFRSLSSKERFVALQSGEIDVLSRTATKTMSRDTDLGINFVGTTYYDGQGFMVKKGLGVKSVKELDGATVCVGAGTTTELNLTDYFKSQKMQFEPIIFDKVEEVYGAYSSERCDVVSGDVSNLEAYRPKLGNPDEHVVLPEIISKEPLTPAVRQGDDQWMDLVGWVRNCQINAEELGVTSKNVEDMKKSTNPSIQRLLGVNSDFGKSIGLGSDWCANVISKVGNYGEVFNNNLGGKSGVTIARGINNLWNNGGILYAAPIR